MEKLRTLSLFSGIGGFDLGLERTGGFKTVAFCERENLPRDVLAAHWPGVPCYDDVTTLDEAKLKDVGNIDVVCAGFPCQDISIAGLRKGIESDTRSGLWGEVVRISVKLQPKFILLENVANLLAGPTGKPGAWFGRVLGDLASFGYDAEWRVLRGYEVGVPQTRSRVFIVATPSQSSFPSVLHSHAFDALCHQAREDGFGSHHADPNHEGYKPGTMPLLGNRTRAEIPHRERSGTNERLSDGVDRYKALGNTLIPKIPEIIGLSILANLNEA